MRRRPVSTGRAERAALLLLVVWILWAVTAAALAGQVLTAVSSYVIAPVALVVGVIFGRLVAPYAAHRATALVLLGAAFYILVAVVWTAGPAKGPLGYANANAALAVQVMGLCGLVMVRTTGRLRAASAVGAALALSTVAANGSRAGFAVAVPLLVVVIVMAWHPTQRRWSALAAATVGLLTVTAAALAISELARRDPWPVWALRAFDTARQTLWHEALGLWTLHPLTGAGPGTFQQVSTLGSDPDTAAAHSAVLQIGAETGWVGVALFAGIVVAGLAWACRGAPADAVIATAAWTALVVHSSADHLLDFAAVVLAAGLVLGWAGGSARESEQFDVSESERPLLGGRR